MVGVLLEIANNFFLLEYSKHEEIGLIEGRMEVLVTKIILELHR